MEAVAGIKAAGRLDIDIIDAESGRVIESRSHNNLIVTSGLNLIRAALDTGTTSAITYFGLGAGAGSTTAVSASQTDLQGATKIRDVLTSRIATTDATIVCQYYLGSATGNGNTFNEAGLFTASSGGTMYSRVLLTPIVKTTSVAVSFVWTLTWTAV